MVKYCKKQIIFMYETKNPREAAFLALLHFHKGGFVEDFFKEKNSLVKKDFNLASEITYSTIRRLKTLEFISKKVTDIKLKTREKLLLYSGMCQYFFMERVPLFAINNETTALAKKYFGRQKAAFFNVFFRKLSSYSPNIKQFFNEDDKKEFSFFYSFPDFFIEELIKERGIEAAKEILEALNQKAPLMFRKRDGVFENSNLVHDGLFKVYEADSLDISNLIKDKGVYIQNVTPLLLLEELSKNISYPNKILDLCCAPGGKLIALHDLYPKAALIANDRTLEKINLLKENLKKYSIHAHVEMQDGKVFSSPEKFDLIILDVPCSNSGVLHKRVEARYRLDEKSLEKIEEEQFLLLKNARDCLSKDGQIWYMTCSILKRENENLIAKALALGLKVKGSMITILPKGKRDGGFGVSLSF